MLMDDPARLFTTRVLGTREASTTFTGISGFSEFRNPPQVTVVTKFLSADTKQRAKTAKQLHAFKRAAPITRMLNKRS
jgi:hypothetical protein